MQPFFNLIMYNLSPVPGERLRYLEQENRLLHSDLRVCLDELGSPARFAAAQARVRLYHTVTSQALTSHLQSHFEDKTLNRQPSFKWAQYVNKPARSPTKVNIEAEIESPKVSPLAQEHDMSTVAKASPLENDITAVCYGFLWFCFEYSTKGGADRNH